MSNVENQPLLVNANTDKDITKLENSAEHRKQGNLKALMTINLVIFFYFLAIFPVFTTTDQYLKNSLSVMYNLSSNTNDRHACLADNSSTNLARETTVESKASLIMLLVNAAGLIPQFIITFILGPCSDQIGRKIAIVLPPVGSCLKAFVYLVISYYQLPNYVLIVGSIIEGVFGGFPLFFAACISYTADLTDYSQRSFWLCVIDVNIGFSMVISNVGSGYIVQIFGYSWMFVLLVAFFAIPILIAVFALRETVIIQRNVKIFTTIHFKRSIKVYTTDNGTNRRWKLLILLGVIALMSVGIQENADAITFLLINNPICFTPELLGYFIACSYLVKTVGGLGMMKAKSCGLKEGGLLLVGIGSYIAFQIILSWAHHIEILFISTLVCFSQILTFPLVRSLISPLGGSDEQGAIFSAATWLQNFFQLIAILYQNGIYSATVSMWRGFFLIADAFMMCLSFLLVCILLILWKREDRRKAREREEISAYGSNGSCREEISGYNGSNGSSRHSNVTTDIPAC